jgi:hypothetical protein
MTKRKVSRAIYDNNLNMDEKKQVLYSDVMHVDGHCFLVTVCTTKAIRFIVKQGIRPHMCAYRPTEFISVNYYKL